MDDAQLCTDHWGEPVDALVTRGLQPIIQADQLEQARACEHSRHEIAARARHAIVTAQRVLAMLMVTVMSVMAVAMMTMMTVMVVLVVRVPSVRRRRGRIGHGRGWIGWLRNSRLWRRARCGLCLRRLLTCRGRDRALC